MELLSSLQEALAAREVHSDGVTVEDVLALPEPLNVTLKKLLRKRRMTADSLAGELGTSVEETDAICHFLMEKGFLEEKKTRKGDIVYRIRMAPKPKSTLPNNLLQALDDW